MAVTSARTIEITYSEGVTGTQVIEAADNVASPGSIEVFNLTTGANTITVPTGGTTVTAVTIVPPAGNTFAITLKGVSGDNGIRIHDTDPTSLAIDPSVTTFVLTAGAGVTGVRFYWS